MSIWAEAPTGERRCIGSMDVYDESQAFQAAQDYVFWWTPEMGPLPTKTPGGWEIKVLLSLFRHSYSPKHWVFRFGYHWDKKAWALTKVLDQMSFHYNGREEGPIRGEPHLLFWYPSGNLRSEYFSGDCNGVRYEDGDPKAARGQLWAQELIARWHQAQREEQVEMQRELAQAQSDYRSHAQDARFAANWGHTESSQFWVRAMNSAADRIDRLQREGVQGGGGHYPTLDSNRALPLWFQDPAEYQRQQVLAEDARKIMAAIPSGYDDSRSRVEAMYQDYHNKKG